ncbi:MAG TPA: beta-galactosidase [Verrucomicrobiae bacterium]|nr:beta-galactosidase [Verrucomicrobiae bacterium]
MGTLAVGGLVLPTVTQSAKARQAKISESPWTRYLLGTAYYPEWWDSTEWETDFRQMSELGFNTVRMGEFAWALFEPAQGKFEFGWMDHAIALANRYGISVILGTPTASVPPWLYELHPDVLGGNQNGPFSYGGRKGYCTNSPAYLRASERIAKALGEHYGRNPGVIGWQLDNEPGIPFECFDANCESAFHLWLHQRYGTIDALNRAWNGAFWSNKYSDWRQIHFPRNPAEGGWSPETNLDYRRFFSDSYLNHLRRQAAILRRKIEYQFITTNWPNATWSVNVFEGAGFLDATAWDNYVSAPGLSKFENQFTSGFHSDFCRCAGPHQRFLCGEQVAYVPPNADKQGLRLQAYINLAHGSAGHLYFEWRRPLAGNEQSRPSFVKGFDGRINPEKQVFEQIGKEFVRLGPRLAGAVTRADIALLYDFTNEWSQGFWNIGDKNDHYDSQANRYYRGLKALQRNIDIVPASVDFSAYKLVAAPNFRLVDEATVNRLREFVAGGGILLLNYRAGTQNPDNSMRRALAPGAFADMAGVISESYLDLNEYNSQNGTLDGKLQGELGIVFAGAKTIFRPRTFLESLALRGAEPIATFHGGRMDGRPAITRNRHDAGWVFYVATDSAEDGFHETLARTVGAAANLSPLIAAPEGIEVTRRENDRTVFYFLLNLTETAHEQIALPQPMDELITGGTGLNSVTLGPLGVAVLALARP